MQKDFDAWNKRKKNIHESKKHPFYHEREIWWCVLGTNVGVEQDGTGTGYERPVVILRAFSLDACLVISFTTSEKNNRYHMNAGQVLGQQDSAIISQLRLIDTKRLREKIGYMEKDNFEHIRKAVKGML